MKPDASLKKLGALIVEEGNTGGETGSGDMENKGAQTMVAGSGGGLVMV